MKIILQYHDEEKDFFEELVERVADAVVVKLENCFEKLTKQESNAQELWVNASEAKTILGVKSNKKMQELRDQKLIRYSQHGRIVRYYKPGLCDFLEKTVVK